MIRRAAWGGVLALLVSAGPVAAASPPDWARDVPLAVPAWAAAEPAVVLLDAEDVRVSAGGRVTHLLRGAVRVHDRLGAREAVASVVLPREGARVTRASGWVTGADGRTDALGKERVVTQSLFADYALYADAQLVRVSPADAPAGSTFWWEIEYEEPALLAQWRASFARAVPVLDARFSLTPPEGFEAVGRTFGRAPVEAARDGRTWRWRARELAAQPGVGFALLTDDDDPGVRVTLAAADGAATPAGAVLDSWPAVSRWLFALADPQAASTPALAARAGALASPSGNALESLRAIARAVARMPYVSRDLSLARGYGFRPHAAANVLAAGSGDCKDKANLALALARTLGVDGVLLTVHSDGAARADTAAVRPGRFDHCIVAFRAPAAAGLPAAFAHPTLGTLVAFDATDSATPFGELPAALQGAPALIVARTGEGLVALPEAAPGHDVVRQEVRAVLSADGVLAADWRLEFRGAEGAALRRAALPADPRALREWLEHQLGATGAATLDSIVCTDDSLANVVRVRAHARVAGFAQRLDDGTLVVRTAFAPLGAALPAPARQPARAVRLPRLRREESFTLELPAGCTPKSAPAAVPARASACGGVTHAVAVTGGVLHAERTLTLEPLALPAERAGEFDAIVRDWKKAERTVVLFERR
ncbi:MAG: transglutaminase domain-containing protein [Candidatus Eisenbacteria bacterium]